MSEVALVTLAVAFLFVTYTYIGYPLLLKLFASFRSARSEADAPSEWPSISITLAAYNEADRIRATLDSLLALDYPAELRQILVISDASSDGTDEIVKEYADRGVELLRMEERGGKDAAETAALEHLTGDIIVNTDATIRIQPDALKKLIATFADPTIGVASGRDVSVARVDGATNVGESGYVGFEMWLRDLETDVYGIVGASGCFYAIRADLHRHELPRGISRDFTAALRAREHDYRSVSVTDAVCLVPRALSLRHEYSRKVRTITRGLRTLFFKRRLLNPFRYGRFAWMLFTHKLCRWLVPWALLIGLSALVVLGMSYWWAVAAATAAVVGAVLAVLGMAWPKDRSVPLLFALPAYLAGGNFAVLHAWSRLVTGKGQAVWEPTRR
jgi:cellulose synthase/poly-beta-1,6-N-acetylglucosamine synthase-like glycosyltransferase